MRALRFLPMLGTALALSVAPPAARAVPVDGRLDPGYGPPLSVQTTQTAQGDNLATTAGPDSLWSSNGSELDAAYGYVSDGVLHLFLGGNLLAYFGEMDHRDQLHVFLDTGPGGQATLRADNPAVGYDPASRLNSLAGLTFDPGFAADYWLNCVIPIGSVPRLDAYFATLPGGGGGAGNFLGASDIPGTGTLAGGTNPAGFLAAIDQSNFGGVTHGCGAGDGSGVTRGIEWAIPLSAIGNPQGPIRVCAFVSGVFTGAYLDNQALGPLPAGTCQPGLASGVDFGLFAGEQFFTVPFGATPAQAATWGRVKAAYR